MEQVTNPTGILDGTTILVEAQKLLATIDSWGGTVHESHLAGLRAAVRADPSGDPRAELEAIRAAVRAHDDRMDDKANDGANAQPPNGDDYNELFGIVMHGAPDPWHLFYIEASDDDGTHAYLMSAQSGSQDKARELAEAVVLDEMVGSEESPGTIEHCGFIGIVDGDVSETIGLLADH